MHKPHLNSTFVHCLPPQDFSPFLDSCIPLQFQQGGGTKTILSNQKKEGILYFPAKSMPSILILLFLSFWFEQEESNNFSFCNSAHTFEKHSSSIPTTEAPTFQLQVCVSKAWTETGLKRDHKIRFNLWLLALKHRSIEIPRGHFENRFQRTKLKSGLHCPLCCR